MPLSSCTEDSGRLRKADTGSRFVAFAFTASEMVMELDTAGAITYAAGAFRSRLGAAPEMFIGRHMQDLVTPLDRMALDMALLLLRERGRLLPCIVRLANDARTEAVLSGMKLVPDRPDSPLCITLGLPPAPAIALGQAVTPEHLMATVRSSLDRLEHGHLALLEVSGGRGDTLLASALEEVSPHTLASEVAPGRFGVLSVDGTEFSSMLPLLEAALRRNGGRCTISSRQLPLERQGLSRIQLTCAIRQALSIFSRDGMAGVEKAGFDGGLASYVEEAMAQSTNLRRSIAQRDFTLAYQPIVHLQNRNLHHYEALLRPIRGLANHSPQELVTLIETVGLADELDLAVAEMACEAADRSNTSVAVNLSGQSVQDPAFRSRLLALMRGHRAVREQRVLVELTETAQVEHMEQATETVRDLRGMGVRFCIDDFGAGSADIRLLRAIPTDIVKLDGSFVPGLAASGRERAFVAGMIEVAHAAGATVVAERVETEAEAEIVATLGATFGQGWLFGRPAPLPKMVTGRPAKRRHELNESWG